MQTLQDDIDEAEADSRYALSRRQSGRAEIPIRLAAQLSAESLIEEQEEIQPAVYATNAACSTRIQPNTTQDERNESLHDMDAERQEQNKKKKKKERKARARQKKKAHKEHQGNSLAQEEEQVLEKNEQHKPWAPMFTVAEAIAALELAKNGATSRPPIAYDLPTGAFMTSYPVKRSYHLGAMGRYGVASVQYSSQDHVFDGGAYSGDRRQRSGVATSASNRIPKAPGFGRTA